jgi:putative ABC transport system permease protein
MFWRLLFQMLRGSRDRLAVALIALISGAAVISALLNLDLDVGSKLTQEFRTLGANVVIAPRNASHEISIAGAPVLLHYDSVAKALGRNEPRIGRNDALPEELKPQLYLSAAAPYLYFIARVAGARVVVAGTNIAEAMGPWGVDSAWKLETEGAVSKGDDDLYCIVGRNVAKQFKLSIGSHADLQYLNQHRKLAVGGILDSGAAADNQIFIELPRAQSLLEVGQQVSLVQLRVNGTAEAISHFTDLLALQLPDLDVRPIRQASDAEGELLGRIRLLIFSMVLLILVLTALCVLATMAALAIERREDVGLMKALGGSISRVVGLFLAEVGVLGAMGGLIGVFAGVALSHWMGQRVFDTAISVRWEIFPVTIGLMIVVALAGASPLRMLGKVKPAVIFRGE